MFGDRMYEHVQTKREACLAYATAPRERTRMPLLRVLASQAAHSGHIRLLFRKRRARTHLLCIPLSSLDVSGFNA